MRLSVSGKIIKEISEKIPSTTYAIVELIKNSYEAMASIVEISVYDDTIQIFDDGDGMDLDDIHTLLIVSHSNKEYGVVKNGRIISGEKGLGFFSIFKFGSKVTVQTSKQGTDYRFTIDMNEIECLEDIHDSNIDIFESPSIDLKKHGTKIVVEKLNSEAIELFRNVLNNSSDFLKLQNSIIDDNFKVKINKLYKDAKEIQSDISNSSVKDKIIAKACFESKTYREKEVFYYRICINNLSYDIDIDEKYNCLLANNDFEMKLEIDYFKFNSGELKKVSDYYKDQKLKKITPLVYFNNVYFSNDLYDVEINASSSSKKVIRQQTGIINIFLMKKGILDFNSDRTMLIESRNQLLLQELLNFISASSQNKIKEIEELEKQQKPKNRTVKMIKGDSLKDSGIDDYNIEKIYYQDKLEETFDSMKLGNWRIVHNNGDVTSVDVIDYPDAKMRFILSELEIAKEYKLDEILEATDCKGTQQIKPEHIDIQPAKNISFDSKNEKLIVMSPADIVFKIKFVDKISSKEFDFNQTIPCVKKTADIKTNKTGFIHPFISLNKTAVLDNDLVNFINEFNKVYDNDSCKLLRVASVRTLLEVICCEILDLLKENKSEYLKENFQKIFSEDSIKNNLFSKVMDDRDKRAVTSIYDTNKQSLITGAFVDKYNYSTHGLTRIVNEEFYKGDQPIFNLLYTYLLFLAQDK
jgi:hypothetical protein